MVFLSVANFVRTRGPDEFWRKRRIFRLAAHFVGRRRNCYTVAVRYVHRALVYATKGRALRRKDTNELWQCRIEGAARLHNSTYAQVREGLDRAGCQLDRKSLSNLASWEPRSFSAVAALAKETCRVEGVYDALKENHIGTDLRYQMFLKKKNQGS